MYLKVLLLALALAFMAPSAAFSQAIIVIAGNDRRTVSPKENISACTTGNFHQERRSSYDIRTAGSVVSFCDNPNADGCPMASNADPAEPTR